MNWAIFLNKLFAGVSLIVSSGIVTRFLQDWSQQKYFLAILRCTRDELNYNSEYRGTPQSPFEDKWLTKVITQLEFHEQCPEIVKRVMDVYELIKDANKGQLQHRTIKGRPMQVRDVQIAMKEIASYITEILPRLRRQSYFLSYFTWTVWSLLKGSGVFLIECGKWVFGRIGLQHKSYKEGVVMPYKNNKDLPNAVKDHVPAHGQDIFRKAFNNALKEYGEEERAFKVAWSAVKKVYEKKGDQWVVKK